MARVLIADPYEDVRRELRQILSMEPGVEVMSDTGDGDEVLSLIQPLRVDLVLLDMNISGTDALTLTQAITRRYPFCGVIITSSSQDTRQMRMAMQSGAKDFLVKPFVSSEVLEAVRQATASIQQAKLTLGQGPEEEEKGSKIVCVYSPQGGVGKSMLAANLAICLGRESGRRTVLVDLDLQFGDIDLMLNLTPERTIAAIIPRLNQLDAELMESFLTSYPDPNINLKVLAAPNRPEYADTITVFVIEKVLQVLKDNYGYVIVDTPSVLQDTTLTALDHADVILLLATLDLLALHNTKTALEMMQKLRYDEQKIKLVLNRANSDVGITVEDVEKTLSYPISARIPSDGRVVVTSVNEGEPFVLSHPHSEIAQSIRRIAYLVMGRADDHLPAPPVLRSEIKPWERILAWLFPVRQ